jgi:hypothetical protein
MRNFATLDDLQAVLGQEVAVSDWVAMPRERIALFPTPPTTISGSMSTPSAAPASRPGASRWRTAS